MFELERGPIDLGEFPLPPRIVHEGTFETHAADYVDARNGEGGVLDSAAIVVAGDGIPDQDAAYASIAGAAEDTTNEETSRVDEPVPDSILVAGGNVNAHAAAVAPFLPTPDTDVPTNFADPPQPPTGGFDPNAGGDPGDGTYPGGPVGGDDNGG